MIRSFRSRALRQFWVKDDARKIAVDWLPRIEMILDALDTARLPIDMNLPGLHFHPLKGKDRGRHSVRVSGNWRITFGWQDEDATGVDLEDYH